MYQLTKYDTITRLSDGASIPKDPGNSDYQVYLAWVAQGNKPLTPPAPTVEEITASIVNAVQDRLDSFARTRNYDGILSAATYATSTIPKFATEGQYAVDVRDATWATLYSILEEVQTGKRVPPMSYEDIKEDLPILVWPN